jgi:arginase
LIEVIGAPFNSAGTANGVARAPAALRRAGLLAAFEAAGVDVDDLGDLRFPPAIPVRDPASQVIAVDALAPMIRQVRGAVGESLDRGAFPLVLGGDCPILLGCLAALGRRSARVLFIDGHEDAWTPERSTTGEAADMELGWLLGRGTDGLPASLRSELPESKPDDVIVLGARDLDELVAADVASIDGVVRVVRPESIADDPRAAGTDAAARIADRGPWWLHIDLDVLATDSLAAVDYRQPGGLDWPMLTEITDAALGRPGALGWDVTIYNPDLDPTGQGAAGIVRFLATALGRSL